MGLQQITQDRRVHILGYSVALVVGATALVLAACTVKNGRPDQATHNIVFAPRPLHVMQDPTDYYPDASKRANETGEVILHFQIGSDGIAQDSFVVDEASTAAPRLIDAAKKLFRRSRYESGEHYRHEVTASVLFEIRPCGKLQQTSGLDYYYYLCIPPMVFPPQQPIPDLVPSFQALHSMRGADQRSRKQKTSSLTIRLSSDGMCVFERSSMPCDELASRLVAMALGPNRHVHISVDRGAKYEMVAAMLTSLRRTGIKIGYVNTQGSH